MAVHILLPASSQTALKWQIHFSLRIHEVVMKSREKKIAAIA